jgi:hypothetical protein
MLRHLIATEDFARATTAHGEDIERHGIEAELLELLEDVSELFAGRVLQAIGVIDLELHGDNGAVLDDDLGCAMGLQGIHRLHRVDADLYGLVNVFEEHDLSFGFE